jgi:hypothetical protein
MARVQVQLKLHVDAVGLIAQTEAMGCYIDGHEVGAPCPFIDLAMEIGEIDVEKCVEFSTEVRDGECFLVAVPKGDLARLLDAFKAVAS